MPKQSPTQAHTRTHSHTREISEGNVGSECLRRQTKFGIFVSKFPLVTRRTLKIPKDISLRVVITEKSGVSFSGSFSRQNKGPHETFAIEKTDLGVSWPGRNWPTGPSERQLPTGSLAQMALEANWEAKTKAKFLLVRSREKLGF